MRKRLLLIYLIIVSISVPSVYSQTWHNNKDGSITEYPNNGMWKHICYKDGTNSAYAKDGTCIFNRVIAGIHTLCKDDIIYFSLFKPSKKHKNKFYMDEFYDSKGKLVYRTDEEIQTPMIEKANGVYYILYDDTDGNEGAMNIKFQKIVPGKYKALFYSKDENTFYYSNNNKDFYPLYIDANGQKTYKSYNTLNKDNEQINRIPEVTIQTLNHEHGVTVNGKKGMKLHYHVVVNNHYKDKINFSVFFYMGNGNKLYGTYSGYTAKDNQVCAFTDATANYSDSEWKDLWFFIPYDAIGSGLTSGNYTIAAQLDVRDIKDGYRTMGSSNRETFNFSYTKPIQNYQQQQNMYGYVPPTNPYNIYNPYMNYSVPSGEQLMNMSLNHINSTEVQINKMVEQYKEERRKATGRYPSSADIENYKQMLRNQDVANMQAVTNMINDNLETKKQAKKTSTTNRQSSRITCPECNGIGFETTAHKYAVPTSSVLGYFPPYKNKVGNKCPYCKSTAEHYHYPCEKCKGHGKIKNPNF